MARRKNPETEASADPSEPEPDTVLTPGSTSSSTPGPFAETVDDPVPEPQAEESAPLPPKAPPPPVPPPVVARSGLFGPILGGALAAVAGFALSHFNAFGIAPADNSAALSSLSARLDALEATPPTPATDLTGVHDTLSGLQARITALEEAPAPQAPDLSALDALDQRLAAIEAMPESGDASTAALAAKLAELERQLAARPEATLDTSEVDAALARLEAAEAEATARATAAADAAAAAERAVALDRLRAAAATGTSFEAELAALGDADLTGALAPHAGGAPTLADLQAEFPDLTRTGLDVARAAEGDQGWGTRVVDFLASQTGARPLTPQEGTTPEAILSRADFAVTEGRLADALAEIATLPPDVQAVFADWSARANARIAVDTALEAQ
jgi:hypothetical protein